MHASVVALAWEFWGRNRWVFGIFVVYVAAYAVIAAINPGSTPERFAGLGSIWFVGGMCFLIVIFAHGSDVRLETADSGFPTRHFLLPVRTSVLVGWPMLQGALAAVLAWVIWDRCVLRPCGIETPFWWTPMLAAGVVTTQALLWVPFGLPWVRVPVAIVVLTVLVRAPAVLARAGERFTEPDTENAILTTFAVVLIPIAFLLACFGVSRARRGDSPDWLRGFWSLRPTVRADGRERPPFSSPMRAQVWYEWRLRGQGFPILVLFMLAGPMAWGVLLEPNDNNRTGFGVTLLFVPILFACCCGSYMGATGDNLRTMFAISVFAATRPMSNSEIVRAKLWTGLLTAVATWVMTLAVTLGWLVYTGGVRDLPQLWEHAVSSFGLARAVVLCVLVAVGPVAVMWRLLVENLWVGLTGRLWVGHAAAIASGTIVLQAFYEWTLWKADPGRAERILSALPWIAGGAVVVKLVVAGWALRTLGRNGALAAGTVGRLVVAWAVCTAGLFGLLVWLVPAGLVPVYQLALGAVLSVPCARLLVAPLVLGWNRHR
jgi:hypothetical protein